MTGHFCIAVRCVVAPEGGGWGQRLLWSKVLKKSRSHDNRRGFLCDVLPDYRTMIPLPLSAYKTKSEDQSPPKSPFVKGGFRGNVRVNCGYISAQKPRQSSWLPVRIKGLEPPRLTASDPKSDAATNYAISASQALLNPSSQTAKITIFCNFNPRLPKKRYICTT